MTTAFTSIQAAIVAALAQAPALAGGRVFANRVRAVAQQYDAYLVVRTDQSAATETVLGFNDWQTVYVIEAYARASTAGADPIAAVDGLLAAVWARLSALQPASLGVMQIDTRPGIDWQVDDGETPVACAVLRVVAKHRTPINSLEPTP